MTSAPWANHPDQSRGRKRTRIRIDFVVRYGHQKDALFAAGDWPALYQLADEMQENNLVNMAKEARRLAKDMQ